MPCQPSLLFSLLGGQRPAGSSPSLPCCAEPAINSVLAYQDARLQVCAQQQHAFNVSRSAD
jgi:hypothetical protein